MARVLIWVTEDGWEASVDAATNLDAAEVTLLHVAAPVHPGPGLLGRHAPTPRYAEIAGEAADELLRAAEERLLAVVDVTVHRIAVPGRPEDVVIGACDQADFLVFARSGHHPGPHSLEHETRFIVDHAPCTVLLTWP